LRPAWLRGAILDEHGVKTRFPPHRAQGEAPGRRVAAELADAISQRGLPALLRHGDRNSMRFSVESRVPFLTPTLADFLLTLPEDFLISPEGETKCILRAALRGIVPDEILKRRDKVGFATPELQWLRQMAPEVREWLREDTGLPFLDQPRILAEFDAMIAGRRPFSWQAWRWINFTRWYNRHMVA
jgi:asparagine synthase (glutamine-hydrolysing)